MIEAIYALYEYYNTPRKLVRKAVEDLLTNKNLRINAAVFQQSLKLFVKQPALSIEDCYLASLAGHRGALPLWTFDKKLAKQSGGLAKEVGLA